MIEDRDKRKLRQNIEDLVFLEKMLLSVPESTNRWLHLKDSIRVKKESIKFYENRVK